MKHNLGVTDKFIRIILAVVFAGLYLSGTVTGTLGIIVLVLGVIFILTSFVGFCPIYAMFGWSTKKREDKEKS